MDLLRNSMPPTLVQPEGVRQSSSQLGAGGAFDRPKLLAEFRRSGAPRNSTVPKPIPVVAARQAAGTAAKEDSVVCPVAKQRARNPKNLPAPVEETIVRTLDPPGAEEYVQADRATNPIVLARLVELTPDCMTCHQRLAPIARLRQPSPLRQPQNRRVSQSEKPPPSSRR